MLNFRKNVINNNYWKILSIINYFLYLIALINSSFVNPIIAVIIYRFSYFLLLDFYKDQYPPINYPSDSLDHLFEFNTTSILIITY